jgi:hypothetical protein
VVRVIIYDGAHYTDPVLCEYQAVGSMDQIREGARVKVIQKRPGGMRTWVNVETLGGDPVTHYNFQEGEIGN